MSLKKNKKGCIKIIFFLDWRQLCFAFENKMKKRRNQGFSRSLKGKIGKMRREVKNSLCVCVCETERDRKRGRKTIREIGRESVRKSICV